MLDAQEEAASRTFAHEPGEGEAWWWLGMLATIKATKKQTGERYSVVEILAPDGYGSVLHVHHQEDEGFYILEGEMERMAAIGARYERKSWDLHRTNRNGCQLQ